MRWYAALALGRIGPDAIDAAPQLWAFTESEDEGLRIVAVSALAQITPEDPRVVPALEQELRWLSENHGEDGIFWPIDTDQLFESAARLGERARPLIPTLETIVLSVPILEPEVRVRAAETIVRIDRGNDAALRFLRRRAGFEEPNSYFGYLTARETLDTLVADGVIEPE